MSPRAASFGAAVVLLWMLAFSTLARAFDPPPLSGPVVDQANVIDAASEQRIGDKIRAYRGEVGPTIQVYIAPSLRGEDVTDVTYQVARAWKLGDAARDDGVLLFVATAEHKIRIETGKGVGDRITDVQAAGIIRDVIAPRLKAGDYAGGVEHGVDAIAQLLGAQSAPSQIPVQRSTHTSSIAPIVVGAVLMLVFFVLVTRGGGGRGGGGGGGGGLLGFLAGMWLGSRGHTGWSSGGNDWGGGGGDWGGGGGGGDWGGGGGDFGGGGASGDY